MSGKDEYWMTVGIPGMPLAFRPLYVGINNQGIDLSEKTYLDWSYEGSDVNAPRGRRTIAEQRDAMMEWGKNKFKRKKIEVSFLGRSSK